jgi:Protein of unknown function (DUF667)
MITVRLVLLLTTAKLAHPEAYKEISSSLNFFRAPLILGSSALVMAAAPLAFGLYQGGPAVEVFSASGAEPLKDWLVTGTVKRLYDKAVKGYVLGIDGSNSCIQRPPSAAKPRELQL